MYVYIYDNFVNQGKYSSVLAKIETRITDLGLNGKIVRMGMLSSFAESVKNELKKGAKTIVAVGDDATLSKAISILAPLISVNNNYVNVPLGFIPVNKKNNSIAPCLGIDFNELACDMLSARRIEQLDLGKANNEYFLTNASISAQGTVVEIDETYTIEVTEQGNIEIINLPMDSEDAGKFNISACDQKLNLFISAKTGGNIISSLKSSTHESVFSFKKIRLKNKTFSIKLDNSRDLPCPVNIEIAKEKISLIVGKNRNF